MTARSSLLEQLHADWAAKGWDPAVLASFRMEADDGAGDGGDGSGSDDGAVGSAGGGSGAGGSGGDGGSDKGFPEQTPVAEMTAEQQAAYWKYQSRRHEATAKSRADYDELKGKAEEADRLRQERETENEKAVREAREAGEAEAAKKLAPMLVQQAFRAEAKGVLTDDQRDALLEDLDLTKYLTDTGEVDTDKVNKKVAAFAPADGGGNGSGKPGTGGQGRRKETKTSAREAGRAEAQRRFGDRAGANK
jgi:hypothetical protein